MNLYCDESCHLENDGQKSMVLGFISAPHGKHHLYGSQLKEIKKQFGISPNAEIKWGKISPAALPFYLSIIDWFFLAEDLKFRALVVPDKSLLDHKKYDQTHDDFYYKSWYQAIVPLLARENSYNIFLDKKDTRSQTKAEKLKEVLGNKKLDFDHSIVKKIQHVQSHDVFLLQLADVLLGALSYVHRGLSTSTAKVELIGRIRQRSGFDLKRSTLLTEKKFNIFVWQAGWHS